ncbi:MAG TPA: hypothetical protein GXZ91_09115 [Christensenellaceae bacterium]|nr:hypothetical protein [Christensenellaceae bacterium]
MSEQGGRIPPDANEQQDGFTRQANWSGEQDNYFSPSGFSAPINNAQAPPPIGGDPNYYDNAQNIQYDLDSEDSYFSAVNPPSYGAPPVPDAPPPYIGQINQPYYTDDGYQSFAPGFGEEVRYAYAPDEDAPSPERIPYKAPPKKINYMGYLYVGLVLLVAVLGVMGISQLLGNEQKRTALVTLSGQDTTYSGKALIVRNETVFIQDGVSTVIYSAEEGAHIGRGTPVCTVYTTGYNKRERELLQKYRNEIKEQQIFLIDSEIAPDSQLQRIDDAVMHRAAETQALIHGAHGNLLSQEIRLQDAVRERQNYIKQKYPDDAKLTRLYDNETSQLQRIDTWTKKYSSTDDGIVSFYTDGFEAAVNTTNYLSYSPEQVQKMIDGEVPEQFKKDKDSSDIYRLVRQKKWGVLMLADNIDWNPVIDDSYQMLIESFESTTVTAKVEGVTKSAGKLLVRLSVDESVLPILYTRNCRIQLSKSTITYAVPSNAIITQDGLVGVVVMFAEGEYLIPVTIVSQDDTQANVVPLNAGYLFEGMSVRLFND